MARANDLFADEVQILKSLYQEYNKRNDFDACAIIEQDLKDISETCVSREMKARQAIQELSRTVQERKAAAKYPHREGVHAERVAVLQREIDLAKQLIAERDVAVRSAEQERHELEEQLQKVAAAASAEAAVRQHKHVLLQQQLSMYAAITFVKWRKDQPWAWAGVVSDCKQGDIRPFCLDPQSMSNFELVNKLWDTM